jgi:hypothetical protein
MWPVHILVHRGYNYQSAVIRSFIHSSCPENLASYQFRFGCDNKMTSNCTMPLGRLFLELIPALSTPPDGNVPSSQLTEHRGIASADCPHVALSGLCQSTVIHSFITILLGLQERGGASILYLRQVHISRTRA